MEGSQGPKGPECGGSTSAHLQQLSEEAARRGSLSIAEMMETIGTSSIAFTILVLALPALTPIPGPFGMLFGTCLAIVSLQIIGGARHLKFPRFVARRRMSAETIALVVRYTAPGISWIERLLRPGRLPRLTGPAAQKLLGIPVLLLAIAIALPIPFGNVLPVIALVVIATALLERDGLAATVGLGLSVLAISVTVGLLYGAYAATSWIAT
ncbi:exopolysaccharide biosynthesis protein [Phyllobacterium salinisoli]|uniref:Exopolysaccharide biosynthesis protein n=2 Tax=Phyllobacterium salinisoli TaxID=1899321 RepID=A0A368K027_9HYPH|nr:exopolysaccharide biosynthesis protein [Phyllobacterium salinisoli]